MKTTTYPGNCDIEIDCVVIVLRVNNQHSCRMEGTSLASDATSGAELYAGRRNPVDKKPGDAIMLSDALYNIGT